MDWKVFWVSLALIFLAEMGDKTQLAALTMAAVRPVCPFRSPGGTPALVLGAGRQLCPRLDHGSPAAFIGLPLDLRYRLDDAWKVSAGSLSFMIGGDVFLAELGDKTMLST